MEENLESIIRVDPTSMMKMKKDEWRNETKIFSFHRFDWPKDRGIKIKKRSLLLLLLSRPLFSFQLDRSFKFKFKYVGPNRWNQTILLVDKIFEKQRQSSFLFENPRRSNEFFSFVFCSLRIFFNCTNKSQIIKKRTNNDRINSMNLFFALYKFRVTSPSIFFTRIQSRILSTLRAFSQTEFSPIWQPLIDVTSEIINSYGCLHSSNDFQTFDVFFKPLLQVRRRDKNRLKRRKNSSLGNRDGWTFRFV